MKVDQLLIEQHLRQSKTILRESCESLDQDQKRIVEGIYNEMLPLIEASLSADQIQQLFGEVEKSVTAGGSNRTMLGKGVDVAKKADEMVNKVGRWLQDTTPVKMFDQKFEKLKHDINTKFPDSKFLDAISQMGIWAKENPGKTAAIIGVLTTIASLAGGPVGGAIAGQVLRGSLELLKGEKLSTAVGKGLKTAAYGWLTGKAVELVGDALSTPIKTVASKFNPNVASADYTRTIEEINGQFGDRFGTFTTGKLYGRLEDVQGAEGFFDDAVSAWKAGDYHQSALNFDAMNNAIAKMADPEYLAQIASDSAKAEQWANAAKGVQSFASGMAKAAQGAVTAAMSNDKGKPAKKESTEYQTKKLSEGQVYLVFKRLDEGPMDMLGKAANWVGKKATNLTTKVTADKLNSAWQKAGSPMDSEELAKFLKSQGIDDAIISQTYKAMKIPGPGGGGTTGGATLYAQVKADLEKVDKKGKRRLMAYLQKQLGTA